ncbi:hypothetical protein [Streptomyces sp. CAU 1734]
MPLPYFEVDVPIHTNDRALHGVHVFTGKAASATEAPNRARG